MSSVTNVLILLLLILSLARVMVFGQNAKQKRISNDELIELTQKAAFDYFWNEANPSNGLIRDRSQSGSPCSIAATGFGLTAICIGVDHSWVSRETAKNRVLTTLRTFWEKPQGSSKTGMIGYKGFFYHFLDMQNCSRTWDCELSSIDTGLLLAGILFAKQYFSLNDSTENQIRALADSIYYRVDWEWMMDWNGMSSTALAISMGWKPESGFLSSYWVGYNEGMILYVLALGAKNKRMDGSSWNAWTKGYSWQTHYGYSFINFPPLFGHQFSHCWIDFRNIQDEYVKNKGITYFENSKRATLAQREYCIANPKGFSGYGAKLWGLSPCDGPDKPSSGFFGYIARGAPPAMNDDGTIAPSASISSMPFTPTESMAVMRYMYDTYKNNIWTKYGFGDAFNIKANWWDGDVLGIDQGNMIIMLENYMNQNVWNLFMKNTNIQTGLQKAGFEKITSVINKNNIPDSYALENYPNPFNPETNIIFSIPKRSFITINVFNSIGQKVSTLVDGVIEPGRKTILFNGSGLPTGIYIVKMNSDFNLLSKKIIMVK
jgi:hypothetical protein